jgi:hypothetical protein
VVKVVDFELAKALDQQSFPIETFRQEQDLVKTKLGQSSRSRP